MSEAMAQKQQTLAAGGNAAAGLKLASGDTSEAANPLTKVESSSDESINTGTLSTDSANTIKASAAPTPGNLKTPSYPFPRMQLRLNRATSHRSGPSHKPFTLLSPTNEPEVGTKSIAGQVSEDASSERSTPVNQTFATGHGIPDDPDYPAPDLYDIVLMLNAEPGLDRAVAARCSKSQSLMQQSPTQVHVSHTNQIWHLPALDVCKWLCLKTWRHTPNVKKRVLRQEV
jgi:hypothetical protein